MATDMTVANTILQQLGGQRFLTMTGAKNLTGDTRSLTMKLPANITKGRITHMKITLTYADLYLLEAIKQKRAPSFEVRTVQTEDGIYAENLRETFEEMTGLLVHL